MEDKPTWNHEIRIVIRTFTILQRSGKTEKDKRQYSNIDSSFWGRQCIVPEKGTVYIGIYCQSNLQWEGEKEGEDVLICCLEYSGRLWITVLKQEGFLGKGKYADSPLG